MTDLNDQTCRLRMAFQCGRRIGSGLLTNNQQSLVPSLYTLPECSYIPFLESDQSEIIDCGCDDFATLFFLQGFFLFNTNFVFVFFFLLAPDGVLGEHI